MYFISFLSLSRDARKYFVKHCVIITRILDVIETIFKIQDSGLLSKMLFIYLNRNIKRLKDITIGGKGRGAN